MKWHQTSLALLLAAAVAAGGSGCATRPPVASEAASTPPAPGAVLRALPHNPALDARILALDPERISDDDVRNTLAKGPAPRIVLLHGGVFPVYLAMESFGRFLTGMGYPEEKIRDPRDGSWSLSPYESSTVVAGLIAWYYEHEGVRPMMVGHSQGGIQAVKVLHELAGAFGDELHAIDPYTEVPDAPTTIVDPLTGRVRPVVGVSVSYVAVVGTGGWALALPNHWNVLGRVRTIPDTVAEFTGYRIALDLFAWDGPWLEELKTFHANGKAVVRNVTLPAGYSHVLVPITAGLAETAEMRDWINAFDPADEREESAGPGRDTANFLFAAGVWHSIKRHWALEAQRLIRARAAAVGPR